MSQQRKTYITINDIIAYLRYAIHNQKQITIELCHPGNGEDQFFLNLKHENINHLDIAEIKRNI